MKIVILDAYAANPGDLSWDEFAALGELTVYDRTAQEDAAARIGDAEVVFINKVRLTDEIFAACPNLKLVSILATGYNIVDLAAAKRRGITVCNVPGYSTRAVVQMTFALLLEICQQVGLHSGAVHTGRWQTCPDFCFWDRPLIELDGKTILAAMEKVSLADELMEKIRAEHEADEHEHHHHEHGEYQDAHARAHANDIKRRFDGREVTNWQILLFGLTGGLIPCPAAITVLLICIQLKALTLGATLVVSFSIGLALTLVTVGVGAAISVQQVAKRWSGFNTLAKRAPYFSSLLIGLVGVYMGVHGFMGIMR